MSSAYRQATRAFLDLILSSSSFEELTSNIYYLDKVTEADKAMIEEIKTMRPSSNRAGRAPDREG